MKVILSKITYRMRWKYWISVRKDKNLKTNHCIWLITTFNYLLITLFSYGLKLKLINHCLLKMFNYCSKTAIMIMLSKKESQKINLLQQSKNLLQQKHAHHHLNSSHPHQHHHYSYLHHTQLHKKRSKSVTIS